MAKILATDLDGTLLYHRHLFRYISKKNVKFLRRWIDEGNRVVLITSRTNDFTLKLQKEIDRPVDFINCTSCQIYVDNKLIRDEKMNNEEITSIVNEIEKTAKPKAFLMTTKKHSYVIKNCGGVGKILLFFYYIYWFSQLRYRDPFVIDNEEFAKELESGDVYKIMIFFGLRRNKKEISKEFNKTFREKYPNIESSWVSIVNDLTPKNCNKGYGLKEYVKYTNTDPKDVYVVGDSGNDIPMFEAFYENSFCMKHSYPSVKKYAKYEVSRVFKLENIVLKGEKHE